MEDQFPGLDFDFLRYMDVQPETQRRIQSHYMPYFEQRRRVVDLACGDADFVEMLVERGVDVVGVDADDKAFSATASRNLPVIHQDVFSWLAEQADSSFDGVFSAHLIEHLPYPKVIELIEQSYRILEPGGIILLVTPNVRSVFSHLEMFYLHFGHITFYHPRLVSFFLDHAGFADAQFGENPQTASPLFPEARRIKTDRPEFVAGLEPAPPPLQTELPGFDADPGAGGLPATDEGNPQPIGYRREVEPQGRTPLHWLSHRAKRWLSRWLVLPLLDDLAREAARADQEYARQIQALAGRTARLAEQLAAHSAASMRALEKAVDKELIAEGHHRRMQVSALEKEVRFLRGDTLALADSLQSVNGTFETFIWARKPDTTGGAENEQIETVGEPDANKERAAEVEIDESTDG